MLHYCYRPLSKAPHTIRLLRLLPDKHSTADIRCELFEYCLQDSSKSSHLYEALSYVWGGLDLRRSIFIGDKSLEITTNLYSALLHLRDLDIPRIIWIDAVCINQGDEEEKGLQIQSMAKIYGKACRVIVWLGETTDNSDQAIEAIRIAGRENKRIPNEDKIEQAIASLLQRPWFRRIWVLQEVAAARHILIVCGTAEIDGYAFCSGLDQIKDDQNEGYGSEDDEVEACHSSQHNQIRAASFLIRGAPFRSNFEFSSPGRASLAIGSLGELIDMYHSHEATQRHDKIYALLGMSSDDISEAGLLPDYNVPWNEVLRRLVKFVLGEQVLVGTWNDRGEAEIYGEGWIIGCVFKVERLLKGRQRIDIHRREDFSYKNRGVYKCRYQWTLQAAAIAVQVGDIVCLLRGASRPTIIRLVEDYLAVIIIAAPLQEDIRIPTASHDLELVWDWEKFVKNAQDGLRYKSGKAIRLYKNALVLLDSDQFDNANKTMIKAMQARDMSSETGASYRSRRRW